MAKPPASPGEIVRKQIVIEWEGPIDDEFSRLVPEPKLATTGNIFSYLFSRIEIGELIIVDATEILARGKDLPTILSDYTVEIGRPRAIFYDTLILTDEYDTPRGRIHGITIFPAKYLDIEAFSIGFFKRKILRCIANRTGKESPALEQIREIAEIISAASPADEPPAPDTVTDAAETVEAGPGAGALAYPDGLEVIKENNGGALDADFLKEVLPNVQYIRGTETDRPERWEHPSQIKHRDRCPWTVFEWKGIKYRAWKEEAPKKKYAVKWEIQERGKPTNRVFDFKNEG